MIKASELQKQRVAKLLELIKDNPELRIVPMVDSEVVASDEFGWWMASFGNPEIEEIYGSDERIYIRSQDEDDLVEELADNLAVRDETSYEQALSVAEDEVNNYDWEKVIAVSIVVY